MTESLRITADAEIAKQSGGCIMLLPRTHDQQVLVVSGGEPINDLHCTLIYFGEDVRGIPSDELVEICDYSATIAGGPIEARVSGHAVFNPTGPEPATVYLVGDSPALSKFHGFLERSCMQRYRDLVMADRHEPWIPHVTAAYGSAQLNYIGPVLFDRLLLSWAGTKTVFDL